MPFIELNRDVVSVRQGGGLWFNPNNLDFVSVLNLEDAAAVDGVTLIERGESFFGTAKEIMEALRSAGHEFGVIGDSGWRIMGYIDPWLSDTPYANLSPKSKAAVLETAQAVHGYRGIENGKRVLVIDEGMHYGDDRITELEGEWHARSEEAYDPDWAVAKILGDWGIDVSEWAPRAEKVRGIFKEPFYE